MLGLFAANSVVVMARRKRMLAPPAGAPKLKEKVPTFEVYAMLVMVAAWMVGLGARVFWPESAFGQFMSSKLNLAAYLIWCGVVYVVFGVARRLLKSRQWRKNDSAV